MLVQRNEPKKGRPWRFASAYGGFPRRAHNSGVVMNSHNWVLRQHDDPAPLSCTRLSCQTMGLKVKTVNPKFLAALKMTKSIYKSLLRQRINARQSAIALVKIKPAADHEHIINLEADIIDRNRYPAASLLVQQRAHAH